MGRPMVSHGMSHGLPLWDLFPSDYLVWIFLWTFHREPLICDIPCGSNGIHWGPYFTDDRSKKRSIYTGHPRIVPRNVYPWRKPCHIPYAESHRVSHVKSHRQLKLPYGNWESQWTSHENPRKAPYIHTMGTRTYRRTILLPIGIAMPSRGRGMRFPGSDVMGRMGPCALKGGAWGYTLRSRVSCAEPGARPQSQPAQAG